MKPSLISREFSRGKTCSISLPNKIKIRTCKLPRNFFQVPQKINQSMKTSRVSRRSTCDEQSQMPSTPSFRMSRENSCESSRSKWQDKAKPLASLVKMADILPFKQKSQNLRKRVSYELKEKFPLLELPPIYSNRVSLEL